MPFSNAFPHYKPKNSESLHEDRLPWLSVLIPAYEYAKGVDRILEAIASQKPFDVECIVRDDSYSDDVRNVVEGHIRRQEVAHLTYIRSPDRKGAVDNWNSLVTMARGEYIVLMHHDEVPLGPDFFAALRSELSADGGTDVLVLGCLIGQESGAHLRRHMPVVLQSFLLRVMGSAYLLRHNFLGPPSVFVIRRSLCPSFDVRLRWLVDVDWMNRGLQPDSLRWRVSRYLRVASLQRTGASITSSLKDKLRDIERTELAQICYEQDVGPWAALLQPRNVWSRCLAVLDTSVWFAIKVSIRLLALVARTRNLFHLSGSGS